jgi:hypothetical protein
LTTLDTELKRLQNKSEGLEEVVSMAIFKLWRGPDPKEDVDIVQALHEPMATAQAERLACRLVHHMSHGDLLELASEDHNQFLLGALATAVGELLREQPGTVPLVKVLLKLAEQGQELGVRVAALDAMGASGTDHEEIRLLLGGLKDAPTENPAVCSAASDAVKSLSTH